MILYMTGTGNSRYCANLLARALEEPCVDLFPYLRDGVALELQSTTPWVFVTPTYAWQMPRIVAECIRTGRFSGSRDAYFVLTCGGETGDAQRSLAALCREKGLRFCGLLPVVMPDNYLVLFSAPKEAEIAEKLAAARPVLEAAAQRIRAGEPFAPLQPKLLDRLKSGPVNTGMYRYFIRTKQFAASDACVGCGKCEAVCPLGNIVLRDGKPVWGAHCTHCMACLSNCPTAAIDYGKATRGKPRYLCPENGTETQGG